SARSPPDRWPAASGPSRRPTRAPAAHKSNRPKRLGGTIPTFCLGRSLGSDPEQVLGGLADLPVAVGEGGLEGGIHLGAVEGGQGQDGPPADRRLVGARGQHGREPRRIAERAEGGDGG